MRTIDTDLAKLPDSNLKPEDIARYHAENTKVSVEEKPQQNNLEGRVLVLGTKSQLRTLAGFIDQFSKLVKVEGNPKFEYCAVFSDIDNSLSPNPPSLVFYTGQMRQYDPGEVGSSYTIDGPKFEKYLVNLLIRRGVKKEKIIKLNMDYP